MKKLAVLGALLISVSAFADNGPKLVKEIRNKAIINLNKINLNNDQTDFVAVKFKIVEGEIEILNIRGTQKALEERVKERLESIRINSNYEENKNYVLKFNFEKE